MMMRSYRAKIRVYFGNCCNSELSNAVTLSLNLNLLQEVEILFPIDATGNFLPVIHKIKSIKCKPPPRVTE